MSKAIPGHGWRDEYTIRPWCKCGWQGSPVGPTDLVAAVEGSKMQYEAHKTKVREGLAFSVRDHLRVVP